MKARVFWLWIGLVAATGCGGDDSGKTGGSSGGVSRSKQLGDLTDAEAKQLCEANPDIVSITAGGDVCEQGAVFASTSPEECRMLAMQCEQSAGTVDVGAPDAGSGDPCASATASGFEGCTLTVGELGDCIRDVASFFDRLTCDQAGSVAPSDVPQCFGTLQSKCPSAFGAGP